MKKLMLLSALGLQALGCQSHTPKPALHSNAAPVVSDAKAFEAKAVYEMTPTETGLFVAQMQQEVTDLRQRVVTIARRNLGQKDSFQLPGEYLFEIHDSQPLYCLENRDWVVFAEHTHPSMQPALVHVTQQRGLTPAPLGWFRYPLGW